MKNIQGMHIKTVFLDNEIVCNYDLEVVIDKIQIVANFLKTGELIHKIYNVNQLSCYGAEMISKLLDDGFAENQAQQMINESNKSKHSPFLTK